MLKRYFSLIAAFIIICSCASASAFTQLLPPYPVEADRIIKSSHILKDGKFAENNSDAFCAQIWLRVGENARENSEYKLGIESEVLELNAQSVRLFRQDGGSAALIQIPVEKTQNGLEAVITADRRSIVDGELCVYFDAKKLDDGSLRVSVSPVKLDAFSEKERAFVGDYSVEKQNASIGAVEIAAGLSGMDENSEVYIISNDEDELFRAVCSGGVLLGFARREGAVVASIEYDVTNKYYISSLSRKKVLDRQTVLDALGALGFSFVSAPDDELFLASQNDYAASLAVRLY